MKRFALLFIAFAISTPLIGCGGSGMGGDPTQAVSRAEDPHLPAEVREYEAKSQKRQADRAAKTAAGKSGNPRASSH